MYSLMRLLFRALNGKPLAQIIVGIIMIPSGALISIAAMMGGDYIYPYWIVAGIAIAIVGIVFIVRGTKARSQPKPSVQQTTYNAPGQYAPQQPYAQPQVPYGQPYAPGQYAPQVPYGQPYAPGQPQVPYGQPYPSEYIPGQPQAPYSQSSYSSPSSSGQQQQ